MRKIIIPVLKSIEVTAEPRTSLGNFRHVVTEIVIEHIPTNLFSTGFTIHLSITYVSTRCIRLYSYRCHVIDFHARYLNTTYDSFFHENLLLNQDEKVIFPWTHFFQYLTRQRQRQQGHRIEDLHFHLQSLQPTLPSVLLVFSAAVILVTPRLFLRLPRLTHRPFLQLQDVRIHHLRPSLFFAF